MSIHSTVYVADHSSSMIRCTVTGNDNWPTLTTQAPQTPSGEGIGQAKVPQCSHQNQIKTTSANMITITLAFTAHICHGEQLSTQCCPELRLTTKTNFLESHNKQVAFNSLLFMMVDTKTVHCWKLTRWDNYHPGQSITKEVIATKDMAKSGSMREFEIAQVTTATIVTLDTGFPEERI